MKTVHVLIVEDNVPVGQAIAHALTDGGMVVAGPVATATEAKRLAVDENPELALVDLNLHGELAIGLINWLSERELRVIAMSGLAIPPPSMSNTVAFLQKPFSTDELFATMHQVMLAA